MKNKVLLGENLEILKTLEANSVDLCYIDPPFFTQRKFKRVDYEKDKVEETGFNDRFASREDYFSFIEKRLIEIKRVLKKDASFYLHCDTHAGYELKLLCDKVFGKGNFKNHISWRRTYTCSATSKPRRFPNDVDFIFFYGLGDYTFTPPAREPAEASLKQYSHKDEKGRYRLAPTERPALAPANRYIFEGHKPPKNGWVWIESTMRRKFEEGLLVFPKKKGGRILQKIYFDKRTPTPISGHWADIKPIAFRRAQRTGWPTQKPEELLERIIKSSSKEGDVVLDCFAGSGTSLKAAQNLGRNYIGIEKSPEAVKIIRDRLSKEKAAGEPEGKPAA